MEQESGQATDSLRSQIAALVDTYHREHPSQRVNPRSSTSGHNQGHRKVDRIMQLLQGESSGENSSEEASKRPLNA